MNIKPLSHHVFIEPLSREKTTASGIVLPDTADKERPAQGVVVAVGPGRRSTSGEITPLSVSVGDRVLFKKYGPDEVEVDGKEYLVASEDDIVAIIN